MKILDKIVEDKKIELKDLSSKIPVTLLEKRSLFSRQCISLKNLLLRIRFFANGRKDMIFKINSYENIISVGFVSA